MKQIVLLRNDLCEGANNSELNIPNGKMASLYAHASSHSVYIHYLQNKWDTITRWMNMPHKICLAVNSQEELLHYSQLAQQKNIMSMEIWHYTKQKNHNLYWQTTANNPHLTKVCKYGVEGQSWKNPQMKTFNGCVAAAFGPEEDSRLNSIYGSLPLFKF